MARRLIATGTTNADGKAAYTYTGGGAGKIDIVAEAIIDGRTYVSETYELLDCLFYDDGISGTASWDAATATVDRSSGQYTELSASSGTQFQNEAITDGVTIEFDYYCTDVSEKGFSLRQSSTEVWSRTLTELGVQASAWCHVKIVVNNGVYELYVNGTDKTPSSHNIGAFNRFFFRVSTSYSIRYKDFKIYSI